MTDYDVVWNEETGEWDMKFKTQPSSNNPEPSEPQKKYRLVDRFLNYMNGKVARAPRR